MRLALLPVFATACNQVLGIPEVHTGVCDADAVFLSAAPVGGIDAGLGVQTAQLSRDERTIVFSRLTVTGSPDAPVARYGDLYVAHRDLRSDSFGDAVALGELNTDSDELGASLSDDLRTLYFARRDPTRRYQILAAARAGSDDRFIAPVPVPLGDQTSSIEPFVTANALFFASRRADGAASLFSAAGRGRSFDKPRQLASLELLPSPAAYEDPVVAGNGLTIYFSAPPDNASPPDIWSATRTASGQPFGPPRPVAVLNSTSSERPAWISEDSCRLYFVTNRTGRGFELWLASRATP